MTGTVHLSMDQHYRIAHRLFSGMGYSDAEAAYAADVLTETDRRGVDTHGIARLPFYYMISKPGGRVNREARLRILRDEPPFLMVDADKGLGVIMAPQAVDLAIQRASVQGICAMGIQNSGHFGAAGYYTAKCVSRGFIALVCSNSGPTMVPVGGRASILGNSPWSMAIPGGTRHPDPVMFDMACSEVARGKCETAERAGSPVPLGWGVDKDGEPSTDPAAILRGGSLLPFGGVKGYCIALLVEALSSMLAFASPGQSGMAGDGSPSTAHFVLLMDPARFGSPDAYRSSIDDYVERIKNTPLATGAEEIIIPGELEARSIRRRTEQGFDLDGAVADSLVETAREIGLLAEGQGFADMLRW